MAYVEVDKERPRLEHRGMGGPFKCQRDLTLGLGRGEWRGLFVPCQFALGEANCVHEHGDADDDEQTVRLFESGEFDFLHAVQRLRLPV